MIRIALVSYLNTRPFLDGMKRLPFNHELLLLPPAQCAEALLVGKCDLALLPVGALSDFDRLCLLPEYCIGATGAVESVFLLAQEPVHTWNQVLLDPHSRTSNRLAELLLKYYWKVEVPLLAGAPGHYQHLSGTTGGVVIGDLAIREKDQFAYVYDLAEIWQQLTALPFTFAVWAYRPGNLAPNQVQHITQALGWGVSQVQHSAQQWAAHFDMDPDFAQHYLTNCIDFYFNAPKHRALQLFLNALPEKMPLLV